MLNDTMRLYHFTLQPVKFRTAGRVAASLISQVKLNQLGDLMRNADNLTLVKHLRRK